MTRTHFLSLVALTIALTACATGGPRPDTRLDLPVVSFGSPAPASGDFVTRYPAGTPLPVIASVRGSLFDRQAETTLQVTLKRDVYIYKNWASFDGKSWSRSDTLIAGNLELTLPGAKDGRNAGTLAASFDLK